ncbi:KpsF/GutQ family sugar-phosphate isomerase [Microvirga terrestris]|uniref:KpsF/GutQ family sugar-phosphate isomerase n=1 Tax=Microvirga terrestris TaxID=2791024 RepID=A0ABS0HWN9_9HYPH|nr:KpsF/GutQ family sugar-phosphate isomerase [Microvirga terrestris]MBF9197686.1 KpsF/GutQ family sugar-phosphate isomerase [Microvirga terrestris]
MALAKSAPDSSDPAVQSALRTLETERDGLTILMDAIGNGLGHPFTAAVETIAAAKGRVIVTGMGKSGHVGRKMTATFASTGTPAHYVHPAEASHGDLGMIQTDDVIIALSWSGETAELADLIGYAKRFRVPLIAITSNAASTLGSQANICLALPKAKEACPNGLAPTTSTTMQLALGDALAVALLERRGFTAEHFRVFHPGGKLGATLKHVGDIMHTGDRLPIVTVGTSMADALVVQSDKSFGCVIVVETGGDLVGIVTDGDVRRHMSGDLLHRRVEEVMTASPITVTPDTLLGEALEIIESRKRGALIVAEGRRPIGLVHVLDLLRAGAA